MRIPRPAAIGVGLSTAAALALVASGASPARAAAPPTSVDTDTSAEIVHLTALDLTALDLPAALTVADAGIGTATGSVDGTRNPRSIGAASNLSAALADQALPDLLATTRQTAPPDHLRPETVRTGDGQIAGLLSLGVSTATSQARWTGDGTCPATSSPLSQSKITTSDLATSDTPELGTLLSLRGTAYARQATSLKATGTPGTRSVVSTAQGSTADLRLFDGDIQVAVTDAPTLTATADGTESGAKVTWNAPAVSVTANGQKQTLPADGTPVEFTSPDNPALTIELSVGQLGEVTEAADGTSASGTASVLHMTATLGEADTAVTVLDADLFPLAASAASPAGGVDCGTGSDDTDNDGLTNDEEATGAATDGVPTDPNAADTDNDGLTDGQEATGSPNDQFGGEPTDPTKADTDNDGLTDGQETSGSANDGYGNAATDPTKADTDGDGLNDSREVAATAGAGNGTGTDPNVADTDGGTVNDGDEVAAGTDPLNPADDLVGTDPVNDPDNDGLTNDEEAELGTNPANPDSDGDGLNDGREVKGTHTDPLKRDTDRDRLTDGREVTKTHTDPLRKDTDRDGLSDGREVNGPSARYAKCTSNPLRKDTDRDGLSDGREVKPPHTNPCDWDTDNGGISDGREVRAGSNPRDPEHGPADVRHRKAGQKTAHASDRRTVG